MSIQREELVYRKAAVNSDGAANGGRMTATEVVTGISNNVLPHITKQERTNGITRYRKIFLHVANTENLTYIAPSVFVDKFSVGDDMVAIFEGSQTDTQASITGSERLYGSGSLDTSVSIGGSTIKVATEDAALDIFKNGDKIRITDMASVEAGTGNEQELTISSVPTYSGSVATFSVAETLDYNFAASTSRVMSLIKPTDMSTAVESFVDTTAGSGVFNDVANPVVVPNQSGVQQNWTLTVDAGGTTMTVVGDIVGNLGNFSIGSDISPANPDWIAPYFTLPAAGFSGTWAAGDTITFTTVPNALPLWIKQIVPAGANDLSNNLFSIGTDGESA